MKYIFIINPIAGQRKHHSLLLEIEHAFRNGKYPDSFIKLETITVGDAYTKAVESIERYQDNCVIVACGGDGTINEVTNAVAHHKNPIIVLPMGTGNDFAKKLYGIKFSVREIADRFGFLTGDPKYITKEIDLVQINHTYYINVMSFGFDSIVAEQANKLVSKFPFLGKLAYKLAIIFCIFGNKKFKLHATMDAIDQQGNHYTYDHDVNFILMAICNGTYYGGGFCPAPFSKIDDGVLDVCFVDCVSIFEIMKLVPSYSKGTAHKSSKVHMHRVISGTITSCDNKPLPGNCDGEIFYEKEIRFKVIPEGIHVALSK